MSGAVVCGGAGWSHPQKTLFWGGREAGGEKVGGLEVRRRRGPPPSSPARHQQLPPAGRGGGGARGVVCGRGGGGRGRGGGGGADTVNGFATEAPPGPAAEGLRFSGHREPVMCSYELIETERAPIKAWTAGVPVEAQARRQLENVAGLPFVHHHIAVMPDVHWGLGATVGSVIPCKGAIVPAAVGVDIGCGMMAVETLADGAAAARQPRRPARGDRGGGAARADRRRPP